MQFLGLHESDCGSRRRCGRTMSSSSLLSLCCCCGAARSTGHPITYLVVVVVDDVTTYVVSSSSTIANSGRALGTQTCERRRSAPGSSKASGSIACAAEHGACVSNDNRVMAVHAGVTWPTKESIVSFTMQRRRFSTKRTPKNIHPWSKVKQSSRWCLLAFSPKRLLPLLSPSISSTKESPDGFPSTNSLQLRRNRTATACKWRPKPRRPQMKSKPSQSFFVCLSSFDTNLSTTTKLSPPAVPPLLLKWLSTTAANNNLWITREKTTRKAQSKKNEQQKQQAYHSLALPQEE